MSKAVLQKKLAEQEEEEKKKSGGSTSTAADLNTKSNAKKNIKTDKSGTATGNLATGTQSRRESGRTTTGGGRSFETTYTKADKAENEKKKAYKRQTTSGGYYSMPDISTTEIEKTGRRMAQIGKELDSYGAIYDEKNRRATELEQEAAAIQERMDRVAQYFQQSGSRATLPYQKMYDDYTRSYGDYSKAWDEAQSAAKDYSAVLDRYNAAAAEYSTAFGAYQQQIDAWRGTIRETAADIETELAQAQAQAEQAKKDRTIAENRLNALGMMEVTPETEQERATLTAQFQAAQSAETQAQSYVDLLKEELYYNNYYGFESYREEPDFKEKSRFNPGIQDLNYRAINGDDEAYTERQAKAYSTMGAGLGMLTGMDKAEQLQMTDKEVKLYNYMYATDPARAQEYLNFLQQDLYARQRQNQTEKWKEEAMETPWSRLQYAAASTILGVPMKAVATLGQTADFLDDGRIDQNAPYNKGVHFTSAVRQELIQRAEDNFGKAGSALAQTMFSMADFVFTAAATGGFSGLEGGAAEIAKHASLVLMDMDATADKIVEAKDRGLSDEQAFCLGIIAGAAEYFSEMVSLEALLDKTSLGKSYGGYILQNFLSEGSEEVVSSGINLFADVMISQDESEWRQAIKKYQDAGSSRTAAFGKAFVDQAISMGMDFAGGALSGLMMGGIAVLGDIASTANYGRTLNKADRAAAAYGLIESGLQSGTGTESRQYAEKMQQRLDSGKALTNYQTGRLARLNDTAIAEEEESKAQERTNTAVMAQIVQQSKRESVRPVAEVQTPVAQDMSSAERLQRETMNALNSVVDRGEIVARYSDGAQIIAAPVWLMGQQTNVGVLVETDPVTGQLTAVKAVDENGNVLYDTTTETEEDLGPTVEEELAKNADTEPTAEPEEATEENMEEPPAAQEPQGAVLPTAEQGQPGSVVLPGGEEYQQTTNTTQEGQQNGTAGQQNVSDRGNGGWISGTSTGGQAGVLAESTEGARQRSADAGRAGDRGQDRGQSLRTQEVSPYSDLGVQNAEEGRTVPAVPDSAMTPELTKIYADNYKRTGKKTVFITAPILLKGGGRVNGVRTGDRIIVQANNRQYSPEQLSDHEVLHDYIAADPEMMDTIRDAITENYSEDEYRAIVERYVQKLRGIYDDSVLTDRAEEEVLCDAFAGINRFGQHAERYQETVRGAVEERGNPIQRNAQNAAAIDRTNGPNGDTETGAVKAEDTSGDSEMYSLETWIAPGERETVAKKLIAAGFDEDIVWRWINDVNGIAAEIARDRARLDFEAADNQTFIKPNDDYRYTADSSTLCDKRRLYQGTFNEIQHRMRDEVLTSDDLIELMNMMKDMGYAAPCSVCYVESRRRHLGRYAQKWLDGYDGEYVPHLDEVTTTDGLERLRQEHPQTYQDFVRAMKKIGVNNPKVVELRTSYKGEIRKFTRNTVYALIRNGGLRLQSFSDFETPHLLDMMQVVMDMAAKGLTSQAYTKVPNFAWVFGGTGIKINLSLIAEGDGLNPDGTLRFSNTEGMDINEAMRLREAYPENVGTILVGVNDAHILAAMADDRIDFIIPFHKSGWGENELRAMGMDVYEDYTSEQNELDMTTGKKPEGGNIPALDYWDFDKTGKENAEAYLRLCAEQGKIPKFSRFLVNNGDGSYSLQPDGSTDGYWKTLTDFRMYDNEGRGAPQRAVRPDFNMEEAQRVLSEYEGGANTLPVARDVVDRFLREHNATAPENMLPGGERYSAEDHPAPAEDASDEEWIQWLIEENLDPESIRELAAGPREEWEKAKYFYSHIEEAADNLQVRGNTAERDEALRQVAEQVRKQRQQQEQTTAQGVMLPGNAAEETPRQATKQAARRSAQKQAPVFQPQPGDSAETYRQWKRDNPAADRKKITKPPRKSRPTISKSDLRAELETEFHTPAGMKKATGDIIDAYADRLLKKGVLAPEDREALFQHLLDTGVVEEYLDEYATYARSLLNNRRIYVNDTVRAEMGDDWNKWRQRAFGAGFYLTNDANDPGLDVVNAEMAELAPGLFDADETDLTAMLEDFVLTAEEGAAQEMPLADFVADMAGREFVSEDQALDELKRQMDQALDKFAEKANLEIRLRDRTGIKIAQEQQKYREALAAEREKYRTRMAKEAGDRRAALEAQRAKRETREQQQRTLRTLKRLRQMRGQASPEMKPMIDAVLGDLDLFAVSAAQEMRWSDKYNATWKDIADMYERYKQDPDFIPNADLERIFTRVRAPKLSQMSVEDLTNLYQAAAGLLQQIYSRNRLLSDEYNSLISEVAEQSAEEMRSASTKETKGLGKVFNDMPLTPMNMLERMAGWNPNSTWYNLARKLEDGEQKMRKYIADSAIYLADNFVNEHEGWVKRADGQGKNGIWYKYEAPEVTGWGEGNKPIFSDRTITVWYTPAQLVHMYLESKNTDNLRHMMGGRTFADKDLYSKGKTQEAFAHGTIVKLAPETVRAMVSNLTPEEQALADVLEPFYNDLQKKAINETSMILNGFEKTIDKNYAPIVTDKNFTKSEPGVFDMTAEGVGSLKARQVSSNPSYNISAFDAFKRSVKQVALYTGMAIPVRDMNGVLNKHVSDGNTIKKVISDKYGAGQLAEIIGGKSKNEAEVGGLLNELQGGTRIGSGGSLDALVNKILSQYIGSVFGLNPSIVLKQGASFPLAVPYLGLKNMPNIVKALQTDTNLINTYTGELSYRGLGYATPETAQLTENPNLLQQGGTVLNWIFGGGAIQWMDSTTVKTMWRWAENKVRHEQPDLEMGTQEQIDNGTSPFYKAVAKEFNNAVSRSQPMYDVMHRSNIMREGGAVQRAFTLFKTVPQQEYNMIRQAMGEAAYYRKSGDTKAAREAYRKVGSTILSIAAGNLEIGLITLLNALVKNKARKYRDDDDELTAESVTRQFAKQFLQDSMGVMLFGDTAAEIIGNVAAGDKWYGLETPGIEQVGTLIDQLVSSTNTIKKLIQDSIEVQKTGGDWNQYMRDNYQVYLKGVEDIVRALGTYAGGLPMDNARAYLLGLVKWIAPEINTAYEDAVSKAKKAGLNGLTGKPLEARVESLLEDRLGRLGDEDEALIQELARLYEAGYKDAMFADPPTQIEVNNDKRTLNIAQQQQYKNMWSGAAGTALRDLMGSDIYQGLDDEAKAKALSTVYDYAREYAKSSLFDDYESKAKAADRAIREGTNLADWAIWKAMSKDDDHNIDKYRTLRGSGFDDTAKLGILAGIAQNTDEETESGNRSSWGKLQDMLDAGLSVDQILDGYIERARLEEEDMTSTQRATEFAYWADNLGLPDEQAQLMKEKITFGSGTTASATGYEKMVDAGLSTDHAKRLEDDKSELVPEDGKTQITDMQFYRLVAGEDFLTDKEKLAAIGSVMGTEMTTDTGNPSQYAKMLDALDDGLTIDEYLDLKEMGDTAVNMYRKNVTERGVKPSIAYDVTMAVKGMEPEQYEIDANKMRTAIDLYSKPEDQLQALRVVSDDSQYRAFKVGYGLPSEYRIDPEVIVTYYEIRPEYDADGNGNYKNDEVTAAINGMSGGGYGLTLPGGGTVQLTNAEKAALWQLMANTTSAKNNPYSSTVGWSVLDAKNAAKAAEKEG